MVLKILMYGENNLLQLKILLLLYCSDQTIHILPFFHTIIQLLSPTIFLLSLTCHYVIIYILYLYF